MTSRESFDRLVTRHHAIVVLRGSAIADPCGTTRACDLSQPMPGLRAVASGGISEDNAMSYLAAGAWAVCPGGSVLPASAIEQGDHAAVRSTLEAFRAALEPSAIPL
jgi:2-keto-3-deoxy-6-phosphogluconate aldolase